MQATKAAKRAPNAAVFGNVTVSNFANINAAGGDEIRAYDYGSGNVNVVDQANTTVSLRPGFGAEAVNFGSGNISISTVPGDIVNSGSGGLRGQSSDGNFGSAGASASVMAYGTINSGTNLDPNGVRLRESPLDIQDPSTGQMRTSTAMF